MRDFSRTGFLIDLIAGTISPRTVHIKNGCIAAITSADVALCTQYLMPGFIDAHVHIESSMLVPSEFARLASVHGTVATVSDPHEIANVLGIEGVRYMIEVGRRVPFYFYFGAPSCVPATSFETAGATLTASDIESLFQQDGLHYLSEMMNYPGVINAQPEVLEKLAVAQRLAKPIDGHAPGVLGKDIDKYIGAGITTDHECFTLEEALEKLSKGMHVLIREGSAARNYAALHPTIAHAPTKVMFCSDDKHPDALVKGHINELVKRSVVEHPYDLIDVLRIATLNPIRHYGLEVGLLRVGDPADFIVVKDLQNFAILETFVRGACIARDGVTCIPSVPVKTPNRFVAHFKEASAFEVRAEKNCSIQIIQAEDGQLITKCRLASPRVVKGFCVSDPERDILKIAVVNRYVSTPPAVAFAGGFGLQRGAIASSVAHDSHNIVAVGISDEEIARAVNLIIAAHGGIALVDGAQEHILPLPVAGIMSSGDGYEVARRYEEISAHAKELGSQLQAPFMTLSFMCLLVIPSLKLSDRGLFDGCNFRFSSLFVPNQAS